MSEKCKLCGYIGGDYHFETCSKYVIDCPMATASECLARMPREDVSAHLDEAGRKKHDEMARLKFLRVEALHCKVINGTQKEKMEATKKALISEFQSMSPDKWEVLLEVAYHRNFVNYGLGFPPPIPSVLDEALLVMFRNEPHRNYAASINKFMLWRGDNESFASGGCGYTSWPGKLLRANGIWEAAVPAGQTYPEETLVYLSRADLDAIIAPSQLDSPSRNVSGQ